MRLRRLPPLLFLLLGLAACRSASLTLAPTLTTLVSTASPPSGVLPSATPPVVNTVLPTSASTPEVSPPPEVSPTPGIIPTGQFSPSPTSLPVVSPTPTIVPPQSLPTASPAPALFLPTEVVECTNIAAFDQDVTIPDDTFFYQSETFTKTWRFHNAGTCTWTTAYGLTFASGDPLAAPPDLPLSAPVAPGEYTEISLEMTAPADGGRKTGNWLFRDEQGRPFGVGIRGADYFWAQIQVSWLPKGAEAAALPVSGNPPSDPLAGLPEAPNPSTFSIAGCVYQADPSFPARVVALINHQRAQNGLPPLTVNPLLAAAAQGHSLDMACNGSSGHIGTDGSDWFDRVARQGYVYDIAEEAVYDGDPAFGGDPKGAVAWWLDSPVHYPILMNPKVTEIGVGFALSDNALYKGRYTAVFGRPE